MKTRLVYSTGAGRICEGCGHPASACQCSARARADEAVPTRVTAKLRLETGGRGGKAVTVVFGLPDNAEFLAELAGALKRTCATGGTIRPGSIELAGDVRERVKGLLLARGFLVKG